MTEQAKPLSQKDLNDAVNARMVEILKSIPAGASFTKALKEERITINVEDETGMVWAYLEGKDWEISVKPHLACLLATEYFHGDRKGVYR